jgi:hypothetical protein
VIDNTKSGPLPLLSDNKLVYEGGRGRQLSSEEGSERTANIFQLMQRGLVYPAPYARFVTFWHNGTAPITRQVVADVVQRTREVIHERFGSRNTTAIFGVSFDVFRSWCEADPTLTGAGGDGLRVP